MAITVKEYINTHPVIIYHSVVTETVYVLSKVYGVSRSEIAGVLMKFIDLPHVYTEERDVLTKALELFGENSLDFADCLLYAYHIVRSYDVFTFDKKLTKLINREGGRNE